MRRTCSFQKNASSRFIDLEEAFFFLAFFKAEECDWGK